MKNSLEYMLILLFKANFLFMSLAFSQDYSDSQEHIPNHFLNRPRIIRPLYKCASTYLQRSNKLNYSEILEMFKNNIGKAHLFEIKILEDLLNLKPTKAEFEEIIRGAKFFLKGDNGEFYKKWSVLKDAQGKTQKLGLRLSSHPSLDIQRHFRGPLFHEFLMGTDNCNGEKCTWFQLESNSVGVDRPVEWITHLVDYVLGKVLLDWNIGPYGASYHIDRLELSLVTNPRDVAQKKSWKQRGKMRKLIRERSTENDQFSLPPFYKFAPIFTYP